MSSQRSAPAQQAVTASVHRQLKPMLRGRLLLIMKGEAGLIPSITRTAPSGLSFESNN